MILLNKPVGLTPHQYILKLKERYPEKGAQTLSYAGRLDPMAEGLLLVLEDEENKSRKRFEHMDKEYVFEALTGFTSDTYDVLGMAALKRGYSPTTEAVREFIADHTGSIMQFPPPYSAVLVKGKPLYWWARRDALPVVTPRPVQVSGFSLLSSRIIYRDEIEGIVRQRINAVQGDFRQKEIIKQWWEVLQHIGSKEAFRVYQFRVSCTSGTYVRALVNDLGVHLRTGALALSIRRERIGDYHLSDALTV